MAATSSVSVAGYVTGLESGQKAFSASISNATGNGTIQSLTLAAGINTILIPTSPAPQGFMVKLPSTNTVATTYKGVSGDTGTVLDPDGWMVMCLNPAALPASFVLFTAGVHSAATEISFF